MLLFYFFRNEHGPGALVVGFCLLKKIKKPIKEHFCLISPRKIKKIKMLIENTEQTPERARLLTILCILTFIGSGMTLFSNAIIYVMFDQFKAIFISHPNMQLLGIKMDMSSFLNLNPVFFLLQALFSALALAGAFLMWNLRKLGFHLYVIAQLVLLTIPKLFISHLPFPFFELSISAVFVYLYYKHLVLMK